MIVYALSIIIPIIEIIVLFIATYIRYVKEHIEFVSGFNAFFSFYFAIMLSNVHPGGDTDAVILLMFKGFPKALIIAIIVGIVFRVISRTILLKKIVIVISNLVISAMTWITVTILMSYKEGMDHPIIYLIGAIVLFIILTRLNFRIIDYYVPLRHSIYNDKIDKWLEKDLPE